MSEIREAFEKLLELEAAREAAVEVRTAAMRAAEEARTATRAQHLQLTQLIQQAGLSQVVIDGYLLTDRDSEIVDIRKVQVLP